MFVIADRVESIVYRDKPKIREISLSAPKDDLTITLNNHKLSLMALPVAIANDQNLGSITGLKCWRRALFGSTSWFQIQQIGCWGLKTIENWLHDLSNLSA